MRGQYSTPVNTLVGGKHEEVEFEGSAGSVAAGRAWLQLVGGEACIGVDNDSDPRRTQAGGWAGADQVTGVRSGKTGTVMRDKSEVEE